MKRFCSLLLALICLLLCAAPALAAEESGYHNFQKTAVYAEGLFSDVAAADWYGESVAAVYELGLMKGDGAGAFNAAGNVTLAETLVLAEKLHSLYRTGDASLPASSPWYQSYVDYALENGLLAAPRADYNAAATRAEFVAILSRALPPSALPAVNDIPDGGVPDVAMGGENAAAIYAFYRAGILAGNDDYGHFTPDTPIRRSAVAAIVSRLAYRSLRLRFTLKECVYPDLAAQATAEDAFFADAAMLGNSLVDGMALCSGIPLAYYGGTGLTVYHNRLDELLQTQYGKVYIEFGINELGSDIPTTIAAYESIVSRIRTALPDAQIYVMAVTPVTKARSDEGTFTMERITAFNTALRDLARTAECWYLDCCTLLCDESGYLPARYGGWDGSPHLSTEGYLAWADVMRGFYA